jgi:hypothetical protein
VAFLINIECDYFVLNNLFSVIYLTNTRENFMDPIGNHYKPPGSDFISDPVVVPFTLDASLKGAELFKNTEELAQEFYLWYLTQNPNYQDHKNTKKYLSILMRIAQVSLRGGHFIKEKEEKLACDQVNCLRNEFKDGHIKHFELPSLLEPIIQNLTQANIKAKVVAHTTELEYILCIQPIHKHPQETIDNFQKILNHIIEQITPDLPEYKAQAVAQGLFQILHHASEIPDLSRALNQSIEGWLKAI